MLMKGQRCMLVHTYRLSKVNDIHSISGRAYIGRWYPL